MDKIYPPHRIEAPRVYLQKLDVSFADEIFACVESDRIRLKRFLPWVKFCTSVDAEIEYIEDTLKKWEDKKLFDYGLFLKSTNQYLGNIGIHSIRWDNDRAEIGYWIHNSFEGQGLVREAVKILSETFFALGFHRLEIRCDPENIKSANVPKALGFAFEGRLVEDQKMDDGSFRDTFVFGRIKK